MISKSCLKSRKIKLVPKSMDPERLALGLSLKKVSIRQQRQAIIRSIVCVQTILKDTVMKFKMQLKTMMHKTTF